MRWYEIRLLYVRELRAALRERGVVINGLLLPLFFYPALLWLTFSIMTFIGGQAERQSSRIALVDLPEAHAGLRAKLAEAEGVELVETSPGEVIEGSISAGTIDAVAHFDPAGEPAGEPARSLAGNFRVRLVYDASRPRSEKARERFAGVLDEYRTAWVRREGESLGLTLAEWRAADVEVLNIAGSRQMGAFLLGLVGPLMMVIMIAVGCLYPAIDSTAGERERSTWETLLSAAVARSSILTAKYLYVATVGAVAGFLNLLALAVSLRLILAPLVGAEAEVFSFQLPLGALPILVLAGVLLALAIAAVMMLLASFARTFKEGQSMVMPFYVVVILPPLLVQAPDLELTLGWALVPVANVTLLFREVIAGVFRWPLIGVTLLVQAALVALALALARKAIGFEDVFVGSYEGSLSQLLRARLGRRRGAISEGER